MNTRILLTLVGFAATALADELPTPPARPVVKYGHATIREGVVGSGGEQCWVFEPVQLKSARAPLVIFLHGYSAMTPDAYRGWIEHLVRRGSIVVYPRYQSELLTPPERYHPNTLAAVRGALKFLTERGHVVPDLRRVAVVGHSAGGVEAATYAAQAGEERLPIPKAVMVVHPGQGPKSGWQVIPLGDYSKIKPATHLVIMVGEDDRFVGDACARRIWGRTSQVKDRVFLTVPGDTHGAPPLNTNHLAPLASEETSDAVDWLAYWRTFDDLCNAAFACKDYKPEVGMGVWSDGVAVKPMKAECEGGSNQ